MRRYRRRVAAGDDSSGFGRFFLEEHEEGDGRVWQAVWLLLPGREGLGGVDLEDLEWERGFSVCYDYRLTLWCRVWTLWKFCGCVSLRRRTAIGCFSGRRWTHGHESSG
jgi:hypothetical protein